MEQRLKSKKNPLYVVTNGKKGSVVEEASGLIDLVIKKFNLAPALEILRALIEQLMGMVTSYAMFEVVKKTFDDLMAQLTMILTPFMGRTR